MSPRVSEQAAPAVPSNLHLLLLDLSVNLHLLLLELSLNLNLLLLDPHPYLLKLQQTLPQLKLPLSQAIHLLSQVIEPSIR
jgi:hypothetical protein